jgi:hypothetical protein
VWVSGALKAALTARYPEAAQALGSAVDETASSAQAGEPPVTGVNARKLVEKLHTSGQLRASFLISVLNQGPNGAVRLRRLPPCLHMDIETMRKRPLWR